MTEFISAGTRFVALPSPFAMKRGGELRGARMGVPVSPRNIFPSNIQGLPTWYEVRVTEKGYLGRRGGVDMPSPR